MHGLLGLPYRTELNNWLLIKFKCTSESSLYSVYKVQEIIGNEIHHYLVLSDLAWKKIQKQEKAKNEFKLKWS